MFQRVFELSNGNRLIFTKNPPFDFWSINYAKGGLPGQLKGLYTGFQKAFISAQGYLASKNIQIGDEEPWPETLER